MEFPRLKPSAILPLLTAALLVLALASAAVLTLRAALGPFAIGRLPVGSAANPQSFFGAAMILLLILAARRAHPAESRLGERAPAHVWMPLAIAAAAAAAFSPSLDFYLLSDDFCFLADAPRYLQSFPITAGNYFFRPVQFLYGGLVDWAAGDNLRLWHAAGLLIHGAAAAILFFLARHLCPHIWAALIAGLLFAWHGAHPEAVAWIGGWTDSLCATFLLAGLVAYFRAAQTGALWQFALALGLFLVSAGAKETGFIFPLLLPLADWCQRIPLRRAAPRWGVFAAAAFLLFLWRWSWLGGLGGYANAQSGKPEFLAMGWLGPAKTLGWKMWGPLFFPWNWSREPEPAAAVLFALAAVLYGVLFLARGADRKVVFAHLFTILASLPALPQLLIGADMAKSRLLYLPSAGFCLLLGALCRTRLRLICAGALAFLHLLALGHNLAIWRDVSALARQVCRDTAAKVPAEASSVTVLNTPGSLEGVYFLANCLDACLAREGAAQLTSVCEALWSPVPCPRQGVPVLDWRQEIRRFERVDLTAQEPRGAPQ